MPGRVKTRLASLLGTEGCARFQAACLLDVIGAAIQLSPRVTFFGEPVDLARDFTREHRLPLRVSTQGEGDLGARIARGFADLFAAPEVDAALIVGSDSPDLPREHWLAAAAALRSADMVLGPTEDGGYYLVGLRRAHWMNERSAFDRLFSEVRWSSRNTCESQRARAESLGCGVAAIATWCDVDTPADLARLRRRLRGNGELSAGAATREFVLDFFGEF